MVRTVYKREFNLPSVYSFLFIWYFFLQSVQDQIKVLVHAGEVLCPRAASSIILSDIKLCLFFEILLQMLIAITLAFAEETALY